jgi:hypothetical protein
MKAGETSLSSESKPVVTYPIPGVSGAIAIATLDSNYMAERVMVKQGSKTTEFSYGDDQIRYEATVDDPEVLVEPWVVRPRTLPLNPNPEAGLLPERGNCEVYETKNISSQIRH